MLTVVDEYTRECVAAAGETSVLGARMVHVLEQLRQTRGVPQAVQQAFHRALHLLVHKTVLVEVERGTYRVDLEIYTEDDLVRESINSERAWESNPPAKFVTPPSRFEDGGQHRPTPTLTGHATGGSPQRQADT